MPHADAHQSGSHPADAACAPGDVRNRGGHWERIYRERGPREMSWFQAGPAISAELIDAAVAADRTGPDRTGPDRTGPDRTGPVIDVGGGTSRLAAVLATSGYTDVTVLDISAHALDAARRQDPTGTVSFLHADALTWQPPRRWQVWHDRAVFHFLTTPEDRARYLATLHRALRPGGSVVLATFAPDGPARCSGLPVARYSADDLAAELGGGFTVTGTRTERHHTPAGAVQPFTWVSARLRRDVR